jgi:choline dehydrogenase-like flavoprotein
VDTYDYIIVGAGSAGSVLANRLGEDPTRRILLLEAGQRHTDWLLKIPIGTAKVFTAERYNWSYVSDPEPNLDGRTLPHPRGKLVGGSAAINAMAYVRGNRADFDRLASGGLDGWSYRDVLPYFKRSERYDEGSDAYRGGDGPWYVHRSHTEEPVFHAFLEAGRQIGYAVVEDYNGAEQMGFARQQHTIRRGRRVGNAEAFLLPALRRGNIRLEVGAHATRILIDGQRAVGVEYVQDRQTHTARAGADIILSAGAINSPQLLMLSGIGPAAHLKSAGVEVRVDLPGVGQNLWDHPMIMTAWSRKGTGQLRRELRYDRLAWSMAKAILFGAGFAANYPTAGTAFVKSSPDQDIPDLQLFCRDGSASSREWFPLIRPPSPQAIGLNCAHVRPESRGWVRLASSDPLAHARIRNDFLATENDRRALRSGYKIVRALMTSPAFAPYAGASVSPPRDLGSDDEIDAYVRQSLRTVLHPAGTCRVGADTNSVVDPAFRVRGIDGLRVIDAAVLPNPIGGNINATVTMFAEKASDIVRGKQSLPPAAYPCP